METANVVLGQLHTLSGGDERQVGLYVIHLCVTFMVLYMILHYFGNCAPKKTPPVVQQSI